MSHIDPDHDKKYIEELERTLSRSIDRAKKAETRAERYKAALEMILSHDDWYCISDEDMAMARNALKEDA